jgi:hypothetical protein
MVKLNLTALTDALRVAEADADAAGWGEEGTVLFQVVGDLADPWLELLFHTDEYPAAAVDDWIAAGRGLGNAPRVLGLVAVSEAWRHLDNDELRAALPDAFDNLIVYNDDPQETWAHAASMFRDRTRPRDLPDHLRAEVRVAICVLRDGTALQMVRDRGVAEVTTSAFSVDELPPDTRMPAALLHLLTAPGRGTG